MLCFFFFCRCDCESGKSGLRYQRHLAVSRSQNNAHFELPRHIERLLDVGFYDTMAPSLLRHRLPSRYDRIYSILPRYSNSDIYAIVYNQTAPATGSLTFPLNYALEPFSCHFELSRQPAVGLGPPYVMSGTINIAIDSDAKPMTWSQDTPNVSTASTGIHESSAPESTASPTPSKPTVRTQTSESNTLSQRITTIYRFTATTQSSKSSGSNRGPSTAHQSTARIQPSESRLFSQEATASSKSPARTQPSDSNGLSRGQETGIGIGAALGALTLIAAATASYLLRRRKHAKTTPTESYETHLQAQNYAWTNTGWSELSASEQVHEKDGAERVHEKDGAEQIHEKDGAEQIHEKDGAPVAT